MPNLRFAIARNADLYSISPEAVTISRRTPLESIIMHIRHFHFDVSSFPEHSIQLKRLPLRAQRPSQSMALFSFLHQFVLLSGQAQT